MTEFRKCDRAFIAEFIELYKSLPCLWRAKSKEYNDRKAKNIAYQVLVDKYKEVEPDADRNTVTKKLNSLRTNFRKELLKVRNSRHSCSGMDNEYKSSLWYYDLFSFVIEEENLNESDNTIEKLYLKVSNS